MIAFLAAAAVLAIAQTCGVGVHLSLVKRAEAVIPAAMRAHSEYVRAGAFYPDAFYDCMGQSEAAEAAHWPPFLAAGARLVAAKRAAGEDAGRLQAFLVGVLTHQVADVAWHSLGLQQGLLAAMAASEFNGDVDAAHTTLDIGGDMIHVHRLLASGRDAAWLQETWDWDTGDISEVLRTLGYHVSAFQINYCMSRGRAALHAERRAAPIAYSRYAQASPTIFDQLEEYPVGGLLDMDAQIRECLPVLLGWLADGAPGEVASWDMCQVFAGKKPKRPLLQDTKDISDNESITDGMIEADTGLLPPPLPRGLNSHKKSRYHIGGHPTVQAVLDAMHGAAQAVTRQPKRGGRGRGRPASAASEFDAPPLVGETGARFGTAATWLNGSWAVGSPGAARVDIFDSATLALKFSVSGVGKRRGEFDARFGSALASMRIDGLDYLLVASPGLSRIDIFDQVGKPSGALAWPSAVTAYGRAGTKHVGASLLSDDRYLYVGAPLADVGTLAQAGAVWPVPLAVLRAALLAGPHHTEPVYAHPLVGKTAYARFGARLAKSGLYVLVGAPGEDLVYGYDRYGHYLLLTLEGEPSTHFGGGLLAASDNFIAIGAPVASGAAAQAGSVFVYKNADRRELAGPAGVHAWFGGAGSIAGQTLYVSAPHAVTEAGELWNVTLGAPAPLSMGTGPAPYAGAFCSAAASNGTAVLCGMPFWDDRGGAFLVTGSIA